MNPLPQLLQDLRAHHVICSELLALAERESQALRQPQPPALRDLYQIKSLLLPRLHESLARLRQHRQHWQGLSPAERSTQPEVQFLVRQVQDLIMRVILLDRENEQGLLRRGLVPPREIPTTPPKRPHFVAELYRRQAG